MIENVSAADEFLYHYTKDSTALNYILKDRSLRLGRYKMTNDPMEPNAGKLCDLLSSRIPTKRNSGETRCAPSVVQRENKQNGSKSKA